MQNTPHYFHMPKIKNILIYNEIKLNMLNLNTIRVSKFRTILPVHSYSHRSCFQYDWTNICPWPGLDRRFLLLTSSQHPTFHSFDLYCDQTISQNSCAAIKRGRNFRGTDVWNVCRKLHRLPVFAAHPHKYSLIPEGSKFGALVCILKAIHFMVQSFSTIVLLSSVISFSIVDFCSS